MYHASTNSNKLACCMSFKQIMFIAIASCLIGYSIAIGIYECFMGGIAANLVSDYYDYSSAINGTSTSVSIDSFPRDIYKNTKQTAIIMLVCGAFGVIAAIAAIVYGMYKNSKETFAYASFVANVIVILVPFCYCSFLTWKLHSLSGKDRNTWNEINREFIRNLERAEHLMLATVVPGVCWTVLACVMWCMNIFTD